MRSERPRGEQAKQGSDHDVITVLSKKNCMGKQRSEQRKERPPEDRAPRRGSSGRQPAENYDLDSQEVERGRILVPRKVGQPAQYLREDGSDDPSFFRNAGGYGRKHRYLELQTLLVSA